MTLRENHNSGDKVSILGYGCMRWPTKKGKDGNEEMDQEQINRLIDTALEYGVNYFDTSPVYCQGQSERATGIALSRHPRESYYIATKMSNFSPDTQSKEASIAMYKNSLKELQTDYLDYMLLHSVGGSMEDYHKRFVDNGILDYLMEERKAGRIRNLGFSFHGQQSVFDAMMELHDTVHWDFVQIQMNYLDWFHANEMNSFNVDASYLYDELTKRDIPVVIMEPLLGGRLSKVNGSVLRMLKAKEPDRTAASWAFRYCGSYPNVLTALSGMTYMEHLVDNLHSFCPLKPLTDEERSYLEDDVANEILKYPTIPCTACQYCMPCPYGLDIPGIFAHYNKCINEGLMPSSTQDPDYQKLRKAFLVGYDRSVPKLRQANHCIECCRCLEHCPQKIEIPNEMHKIDEYVEKLKQGLEL
jgi:predicted aldo/keto reductase-like oxidoreductase